MCLFVSYSLFRFRCSLVSAALVDSIFFFQAEDGIRDAQESRGLGDVYKRQTDADPHYPAFALPRIVDGLQRAVANLAPARVGWTVAAAPEHTHTRVWIRRPDKRLPDPFGELTVRANMHPGHQNPDTIGPSGPSDPALTLLAVQSPAGRPLAVLANYSMHYFGAPALSADYYGVFAEKLGTLLGADGAGPAFVGIMSQGTSGDQQWMAMPTRHEADRSLTGEFSPRLLDLFHVGADAERRILRGHAQPDDAFR